MLRGFAAACRECFRDIFLRVTGCTCQIGLTHSISAGLDYPSIGPEHAALADSKRAEYVAGFRC